MVTTSLESSLRKYFKNEKLDIYEVDDDDDDAKPYLDRQ
jgi:hypothetical protein